MKKRIASLLAATVAVALLSGTLVSPALATSVSIPDVVLSNRVVGGLCNYTVTFRVDQALAAGATITIVFPAGTNLANITAAADTDCTVAASSGIGVAVLPVTPAASAVDATGLVLTVTVPGTGIGAIATVRVVVGDYTAGPPAAGNGVVNPQATGEYALTVKTSTDGTPVDSAPYTLTAPSVPALEGVVRLYNPSGILMEAFTGDGAITAAINSPTMGEGFTIQCSPGTYDMEDIDGLPAGVTVVGTDGAAATTLGDMAFTFANVNTVDLDGVAAVLDGFTIGGLNVVNVLADRAVIKNCTFMFYAGNAITIGAGGTNATVQDCTFWIQDPLFGIPFGASNNGIVVGDGATNVDNAVVTGGIFYLDDGKTGVVINGRAADDVAVTGCTFNGPGGTGTHVTDGRTSISTTTMSGLSPALRVDGRVTTTYAAAGDQVTVTAGVAGAQVVFNLSANVTAAGTGTITATSAVMAAGQSVVFTAGAGIASVETIMLTLDTGQATIAVTAGTATTSHAVFPRPAVTVRESAMSACGAGPSAANWWAGVPAILVNAAASLDIASSVITGGPDDIIEVQANANNVSIMSNDLSGNAKGIDNNDAANTVNATLNWWGSAAGPAAGFNSGLVNAAGYTGTTTSGVSSTTTSGILAARATQGIEVTITVAGAPWIPAAGDIIAVARYTANPHEETPSRALPDGFYDVLVTDSAGAAQTEVLIKLYNDAITDDTVTYVWSDLQGRWVPCSSQGSNTFNGFVWVKVTAVADSVPTIADLQGTPFALVEPVTEDDLPPAAPILLTPAFAESLVPVNTTFIWTASPGAISYELEISQEIGLDDKFTITDYRAKTTTHAYIASEALRYDTTYNWRVRAISDAGVGDWTTSFFTTAAEPEPGPEPAPPVIIEEVPPSPASEVIVQVPPPETPVQVIQVLPDYLLWTVVGTGSVLLIVIIVLVTRTRRLF